MKGRNMIMGCFDYVKGKIKCPNCGQTLCKLEYGKVEIKCTRCKKIITITKTTEIKTTEPIATP